MKRYLLLTIVCLLSVPSRGQLPAQESSSSSGNEFFVGRDYGKPLVKINLINGVNQPGVYHVPNDTNLAELLAYAGGAGSKSDLQEVHIRRLEASQIKNMRVDLEAIMEGTSSIPQVAENDIIHITQKTTIDTTSKYVGLISGILSVALSVVIIDDVTSRD